jgi:Fe-S-cluster containining protein
MSAPRPPSARERLLELYAKLDAFFARAHARHGDAITCHTGCADCCHRRFSVTAVEAELLAEALNELDAERRRELARRAREGDPGVCPALDDDDRCALYAARPSICRSHGLPIRFGATPAREGGRSLPLVDACPRNFAGQDLAAIDASSVLDQTTLSTVLGALDAARAGELDRPRGARVEIADLLAME